MEQEKHLITIDGSSFTGKSTVSQELAKLLGYQRMNTGSMFRAVAYLQRERNIADTETEKIINIAQNSEMDFKLILGESRFFVNGVDFTEKVKDNELVHLASGIAQIEELREVLMKMQRRIGSKGGFVVEGRDTGTVVFPDAKWKFFLDANINIKIKRFFKVLREEEKQNYTIEQVRAIIEETDKRDRNRVFGPLRKAEDAIVYDNSCSPNAQQDAAVLWHYIKNYKEIILNSKILENKD